MFMGKRIRTGLVAAGIAVAATLTLAQPASAGEAFPKKRGSYITKFGCVDAGESGVLAGKWRSYSCSHSGHAWWPWDLYA
jgi:hypothetical protein